MRFANRMHSKILANVSALVMLVLVVAACGSGAADSHSSSGPTPPPPLPGRIVFVDLPQVPGHWHVYMLASDGSGRTLVSAPPAGGDYHHPTVSPDGTRILFDRMLGDFGDRIMVVNTDGSGLRDITHGCTDHACGDDHPAWSPSGTRIAFERFTGVFHRGGYCCAHASIGIWIANADGTHPHQLTQLQPGSGWEDHAPSFSPDGRRLLFMRDGDGPRTNRSSIWTIAVNGTHPRLVYRLPYDRPGGGGNARWSPDGSRILFSDNCLYESCRPVPAFVPQVFTIRPDGTDLHQLTHGTGGTHPAWSPDGHWIVLLRPVDNPTTACPWGPRHELYVMKANGTAIRRITTSANVCDPGQPDWGP